MAKHTDASPSCLLLSIALFASLSLVYWKLRKDQTKRCRRRSGKGGRVERSKERARLAVAEIKVVEAVRQEHVPHGVHVGVVGLAARLVGARLAG